MGVHEDNPWAKEAESNASRAKQSDINNMKWTIGDHNIRLCPPIKKGALPFIKYIVHWIPVTNSVKDRPIVHAVDYRCPVCKYVSQLYAEVHRLKEEEEKTDNDPEVKKLQRYIGKLRGKKTYDMNIIHRNDLKDENNKIKIKRLVAGPTIWKPILELGNSEKWGNPSSAGDRGYDLTVTVDGEKLKREYTILPDPDRCALNEEELDAVKNRAYNLEVLRKFSTPENILDIIENAKPPLNNLNLDKIAKELNTSAPTKSSDADDNTDDGEDIEVEKSTPTTPATATSAVVDDDDDEKMKDESNDTKEENAFKDDDASDDNDANDDVSAPVSGKAFTYTENDIDLECRGTYDKHDVGCQECDYQKKCKALQKEFNERSQAVDLEISGMLGTEIEKKIVEAEAKQSKSSKSGKSGKQGKQGKQNKEKRDLPF